MVYNLTASTAVLDPHQNHLPPAQCNGLQIMGMLAACSFFSWTAIASISLIVAWYSAVPDVTALSTLKSVYYVQNVLVLRLPPMGENQCQWKLTIPFLFVAWYHLIALSTVPSSYGCQLNQGLCGEQFCISNACMAGFLCTFCTKSLQWKEVCPESTKCPWYSISLWQSYTVYAVDLPLTSLSKAEHQNRISASKNQDMNIAPIYLSIYKMQNKMVINKQYKIYTDIQWQTNILT